MSRAGVKKMVICEDGEPKIPAMLSDRVTQLIGVVRPSKSSEERRNRVAKYVRKLIADCFAPEHKVQTGAMWERVEKCMVQKFCWSTGEVGATGVDKKDNEGLRLLQILCFLWGAGTHPEFGSL